MAGWRRFLAIVSQKQALVYPSYGGKQKWALGALESRTFLDLEEFVD